MKMIIHICCCLLFFSSFGQGKATIKFKANLSNEVKVESFKFYVGISEDGKEVDQYFLVDLIQGEHEITVPKGECNYLLFGTDSLSNVSGAFEGELDPIHGMYWAWNTGFINVKLEGKRTTGEGFSWHLGGYSSANACASWFDLSKENQKEKERVLTVDLESFLEKTKALDQSIMHPSSEAKQIFEVFISSIHVD